MKIGVFDSGVGGQSVANAIQKALPNHQVKYVEDHENIPYGTKKPEELYKLVLPILQKLVSNDCKVIVIACNTVTTTLIEKLRQDIAIPLVGIEPMLKPATQLTKSGIIAVCATPTTLASSRYANLKKIYAKNIKVLEPDCSDWTAMIEAKQIDHEHVTDRIESVCRDGADVIVLGCTHYHWIETEIQTIANKYGAKVIQPEKPVIEQLKRVLARLS